MLQAYLCHETCEENGSIIEAAAGWAGKCQLIRSNGALLRSSMAENVTIEKVRDNWTEVTNMEKAKHFKFMREATVSLVEALETMREGAKISNDDDDSNVCDYTEKDLILYALGGLYNYLMYNL